MLASSSTSAWLLSTGRCSSMKVSQAVWMWDNSIAYETEVAHGITEVVVIQVIVSFPKS